MKIGVIGYFGSENVCSDGQSVKTRIIAEELSRIYPDSVLTYNTLGGVKRILYHVFYLCKFTFKCDNIIILPAHNSLRIFAPILAFLNFFLNRRLHYIVIGGWLPEFLAKRKWLKKTLLKFNYIYVETSTMKRKLEANGFSNVIIMPNCKDLSVLSLNQIRDNYTAPYRLCTLSRVIDKKGIEDAINVVKTINEKSNKIVFQLDIYGPVADSYENRFAELKRNFPNYISYKGIVPFDKTVEVLKDYFLLLFPTHYFTEGIPGTILDAYAAGVPVVYSRWVNCADLIADGKEGLGFEFDNYDEFLKLMFRISENPSLIKEMKPNCLNAAMRFTTEKVISTKLLPNLI